jgi:hypothetical protein
MQSKSLVNVFFQEDHPIGGCFLQELIKNS